MTAKVYAQGDGTGLCAVFAIINALCWLHPGRVKTKVEEALVGALVDAYPGDAKELIRDGCERDALAPMIEAARCWTAQHQWPSWSFVPVHPAEGEKAAQFWDRIKPELKKSNTAAVIGFGDDTVPSSGYEPHWTCVADITEKNLSLRDSAGYGRVRIDRTGIRPEPGWAVEDAYILKRG